MCTGLFSCMDQRHVVIGDQLAAMEQVLERDRDAAGPGQLLSATDTLLRVITKKRGETTTTGESLSSTIEQLYEAACQLYDAPHHGQHWRALRRRLQCTRRVFECEMQSLRDSCGPRGALAAG